MISRDSKLLYICRIWRILSGAGKIGNDGIDGEGEFVGIFGDGLKYCPPIFGYPGGGKIEGD